MVQKEEGIGKYRNNNICLDSKLIGRLFKNISDIHTELDDMMENIGELDDMEWKKDILSFGQKHEFPTLI